MVTTLVVALTIVSSGCKRGESDDRPGGPPIGDDPCKVLTKREVRSHFNVPPGGTITMGPHDVTVPTPIVMVGMQWCDISYRDSDPERNAQYGAHIGLLSTFPEAAYRQWKGKDQHADRLRPVKGLGKEAVWMEGNKELVVLTEDHVLAIDVVTTTPAEPGSTELYRCRKLAEKALARL